MPVTSGFFNSLNGDRKYNAEQMARIFDGIITDGVFSGIGELFATVPGEGLSVVVKTGRAWFDHTWTLNDTPLSLALTAADVTLPRIDAVVLEVNADQSVRQNTIKVVTGTPASNPTKPTLTKTTSVKQYALSYVKVIAGANAISASDIENHVGYSDTPFAAGVMKGVSIEDLFTQWDGEFDTWFEHLKTNLAGDTAGNLQLQLDNLRQSLGDALDPLYKAAANGRYIKLTFIGPDGKPLVGAKIEGLTDIYDSSSITDSNGIARGSSNLNSTAISISGYADITFSSTISTPNNSITEQSFTLNTDNLINFCDILGSKTVRFSSLVSTVDVTVVGGGGGGSAGLSRAGRTYSYTGGSGGGGGYCVLKTGLTPSSNEVYSVIVGAGGAASDYADINGSSTAGSGGSSSFMGVTANGGTGATTPTSVVGAVGVGNGNGGSGDRNYHDDVFGQDYTSSGSNGGNGAQKGYISYNSLVAFGGGGGGGHTYSEADGHQYSGGSPGGGKGGERGAYSSGGSAGEDGKDGYGGGGGGGSVRAKGTAFGGGKGGSGRVTIRIHHNVS